MIVWLTPTMIAGLASGSCTFRSSCRFVTPNASPASSESSGTCRMPRLVSRIAGGRANTTVASIAVVAPPLNNRMKMMM